MAVVDETKWIFLKNMLSLFDFLNIWPVYTLQTSTCLLLQTNPLPLQISNGEAMKSLWVTKLKLIENQKGLALQSWI